MPDMFLFAWRGVASFPRRRRLFSIMGGLVIALVTSALASAQTFPLTRELQTGQLDEFGVVYVEADADGALVFDVDMDSDRVGAKASIRRLFFNLLPQTSGLRVEPLGDEESIRVVVRPARRKLARSGARFDWRIDVHPLKGRARQGRGQDHSKALHRVRFRIFADAPLVVEDLLPISLTRDGEPVQMVVKMKQGRTPEAKSVRWIGGVYEPLDEPPIMN